MTPRIPLSQLENGKIQKLSPNVLHSLALIYAVPYEALMEEAGYLFRPRATRPGAAEARLTSRSMI